MYCKSVKKVFLKICNLKSTIYFFLVQHPVHVVCYAGRHGDEEPEADRGDVVGGRQSGVQVHGDNSAAAECVSS